MTAGTAPLSVEAARAAILADAPVLPAETVPISTAHGRVLAEPLAARLTQPPFAASAMDGYAVQAADVATLPAHLTVVGEAAAGHPFPGRVGRGQAVRIFTGAPLPADSDAVVIQENTTRAGSTVTVVEGRPDGEHVRAQGSDFAAGAVLLEAGRVLGPRELSLAAAMGHGEVPVRRRPRVAVLATGDELVAPGVTPRAGQIVASNHLGVAALAERAGAVPDLLGIARDTAADLGAHVDRAAHADILVTIGGASVGDHDLVAPVLASRGLALAFWKIAMRPGKPLMFGALRSQRVLGLPGNPVSALICARVFLVPLVHAMLGRAVTAEPLQRGILATPIGKNGPRQHYMRAISERAGDGTLRLTPVASQDSALLAPLAAADVLLVRPPGAPAAAAGASVDYLPLDL